MKKSFKRDTGSLGTIFEFLEGCISSHKLNESLGFTIKFAVEDIFTNMVKYNSQSPRDISIALNIDGDSVIVQLIDFQSAPFDLTKKEELDLNLPIEQRKPGGLGIHLVKNMVHKVEYDHSNNKSTVTLTMRLRS